MPCLISRRASRFRCRGRWCCGLRLALGDLFLLREDFRDQTREIIAEDALAIAAGPQRRQHLQMLPIHRATGTHHLEALAAGSLNNFYVIGSNRKIHIACLLPFGAAVGDENISIASARIPYRAKSYRKWAGVSRGAGKCDTVALA